ncbi:MAG: class I SAM-dependent methyltransferase, partial [Mycobacterium sp.]
GIDLRQDWPMALRQMGFDVTQPTVWIAEGPLAGWSPDTPLLDDVTALSAAGSRFGADDHPGEHHDAAEYLAAGGWETVQIPLADLFAATGLPGLRHDDPADGSVASSYVSATRI